MSGEKTNVAKGKDALTQPAKPNERPSLFMIVTMAFGVILLGIHIWRYVNAIYFQGAGNPRPIPTSGSFGEPEPSPTPSPSPS